jgi:hypothetical protein
MKKIIPTFFILLFCTITQAQQFKCTVEPSDSNFVKMLKELYPKSKNYNNSKRAVREIALNIIILQYNNGTVVSTQQAMQIVEEVNVIFANVDMHFNLCNISFAPYPYAQFPNAFEEFDAAVESYIANTYYQPGYLNIYYVRNTNPSATLPNSFPLGNQPRIVINQAPALTLAHEMGHFFSLIHTHVQNYYNPIPSTDELVNGSNCATAGDFICDTPADPGLYDFRMAPWPVCQYIDTVTADINGDIYNPIVNNFMSALSLCSNSFTAEQFDRMAYILDHHRAYLKTGGMNFTMDSIPRKVCVTDTAVALSSTTPGGVFSGNGVTGNIFNPSLAGPGNHIINYTLPPNSNSIETTDAYFFYIDTLYQTNQVWQSFQVENDGSLTGFAFGVKSSTNQTVNYSIYSGNGIGGALLQQGTLQINANTDWDWIKAPINNLPVITGSTYTVEFTFANTIEIIGNKNNYYPYGQSIFNNDVDFISYLIPTNPNCSNTYSVNVLVSSPTTLYSDHIFDSYCPSFPSSFPEFEPAGGIVSIDNIINSAIEPSNLSVGQHTVTYTFNNQLGCISVLTDSFLIDEPATMSLANNSVFCASDGGIQINTTGSGGNLYLDGNLMGNNYLDIPNLNVGNHAISYAIDGNDYNWSEIDQLNFSSGNPSAFSTSGSGQYWQSFTANKNGYLSEIKLAVNSPVNINVSYKLYKGEGIFSLPIFNANTSFGGQGFLYNSFMFPDSLIEMKQDSVYTFQVNFQGNVFTETMGDFTNNYTRGKNNFSFGTVQSDFWFKTYVKPYDFNCLSDSVVANFEIVPSLNVNLGQDTIISTGQSITLDAGNTGNSYLWSTGDTSQTILVNGTATIWVQVTSSSGCIASDTISIDLVTDLSHHLTENEIKIWPNPINNSLQLSTVKGIESVELIDMLGQVVMAKVVNTHQTDMILDTENLSAGIYTVHIRQANKSSYLKVLKQ